MTFKKFGSLHTIHFLISLVLLTFGVIVRSIEVVSRNYVFVYDQGRDYLAAWNIAIEHKWTLIGAEAGSGFAGLPGIFHGPGYFYLLSAIIKIFGGDPYWGMVVLFMLSIISLLVVYWVAFQVFGRTAAVIALAIAVVSPPLIVQARMIWAPNFAGLFIVLALASVVMISLDQKWRVGLASFLAASLYHFEIPLAVPMVVALGFWLCSQKQYRNVTVLFWFSIGVIIGIAPAIIFELRHGLPIVSALANPNLSSPILTLKELNGDLKAFTYVVSDLFNIPQGLYTWVVMTLLVIYVWGVNRGMKIQSRRFLSYLLFVWLSHIIVFTLYKGPVYSHYLTALWFVTVFFVSGVCVGKWKKGVAIRTALVIMFIFGIVRAINKVIYSSSRDFYGSGGTAKIRGKMNAINTILADANGQPFRLMIFSPPVYTYPYDYILTWIRQSRPSAVSSRDAPVLYLLIEPDGDKPWTYKGWIETVVKQGNVEKQWKLPSGFIIEKRRVDPI